MRTRTMGCVSAFGFLALLAVLSSVSARADETVEDFDGNGNVFVSWATDTNYPWVYTMDFANTQHVHQSSYALQVDYDKTHVDEFNPYNESHAIFSFLGGWNFRNYDYLSFWVYQETNKTLQFRLKLEDKFGVRELITTNGGQVVTNVIGYWESGWANMEPKTTTSGWANIVFDLTRTFSDDNKGNINQAQLDMGNIRQIMFIVQPGNSGIATNDKGRFWMDDMKLSRGPNPAPLEIFDNDFFGWSTPGTFSMSLTNETSMTNLGNRCLKVAWINKPNGNWDHVVYQTAHDAASAPTGRIGNYKNLYLRGNTNLSVWVKSTGGNIPILAKIDAAELGTKTYTGAGAWQKLSWGYGTNAGKTNVSDIIFFPFPGAASTGGVLYLDDVMLDGGTAPVLPSIPTGLVSTPLDVNDASDYKVSWNTVSGANNYELLESVNNLDFAYPQAWYPSGAFVDMLNKSPQRYYYTVRCNLKNGTNDNYGAFCKPIAFNVSKQTTYDPAAAFQGPGDADNGTFATECAEFDNVSAKFFMPGLEAFRVEVTHPSSEVGELDVRHVDFGEQGSNECEADPDTNRIQWIGIDNGDDWELRSHSFQPQEIFFRDEATYSSQQAWTNFPAQLGGPVTAQVMVFTTDAGFPATNFAYFTIDFGEVNGSLNVDVFACKNYQAGTTNWTLINNFTATTANHQHGLGVPDGTFTSIDPYKNAFKLQVRGSDSSPGAYARYDDINYQPSDVNLRLYDDGIVVISAVRSGGWWREYKGSGNMTVEVLGGGLVDNVHVVEIARKAYDITKWYGFMVVYEDGNMRLAPQPPTSEFWVPYGPSVIMGPIEELESERPYTDVKRLTIDPKDFSVDVTYQNDETAHFEMYVDRERAVLDVTDIGYATSGSNPFTIMRSMWVFDGKSDIDTVYTAIDHKSMLNWSDLDGSWWQFARDVASYHNTLSPDELISAISPTIAYLVQQAETGYSATGAVVASRNNAVGGQVLNMSSNGAAATYTLTLTNSQAKSSVRLRYSDYVGGNEVTVYFDGALKDSIFSQSTAGWSSFELTPEIALGDLSSGIHTLKVTTASGTEGVNIDQVELVSYASSAPVPVAVLTQEIENYATKSATCLVLTNTAASSNKYIQVDKTGGWLEYPITVASALTNPYIRFRYSDAEGAVSSEFDEGGRSRDDRVDVLIDGHIKCRFPTFSTGGWTNFVNGQTAYLDSTLLAGVHTVRVEVGVASRVAHNVISTQNAGFESGSASPWTATGGTIAATTATTHQGTYAGKLTLSTAGSGTAYQEVNPATYGLQAGDEATASAWIKTDLGMGSAGACVQLEFLNGTNVVGSKNSYIFLNPADWELIRVSDALPAGTTKIRIRLSLLNGQNGNYAYFDDAGLDLYSYPGSATNASSLDKFEIVLAGASCVPPTYAPNGGTYTNSRSVSLSSATVGSRIYYTTNGSQPTTGSTWVTNGGLVTLTGPYSNKVRALAVATGYVNSAISTSALFHVIPTAAGPTYNPNGGTFTNSRSVILSSTAGSKVYYTTNGTAPTTNSAWVTTGGSFTLSGPYSNRLQAFAVATGYVNSAITTSALFQVILQAGAPTYNPNGGIFTNSRSVVLSSTAGSKIYYTTNGTAPTTNSAWVTAGGSLTLSASYSNRLRAFAVATGYLNSAISTSALFQVLPQAGASTFNPNGGTYTNSRSVILNSSTAGSRIYYTTNGTAPTTNSPWVNTGGSITLYATYSNQLRAFTVATNYGNSSIATSALFVVKPANTPPVASNQVVSTSEDTPKAITLKGGDAETTNLTYAIASNPTNGALSGAAPNVTYTPSTNRNGMDSFTFKVSDGSLTSAPGTVTITVTPVNDAPVANGQAVGDLRNTAKAITLTGTDVDSNALTYVVSANPTNGALSGTPPSVTYTPTDWFVGTDSFKFRVHDGTLTSSPATVTLTVTQSFIYVNATNTSGTENGTAAFPYNTLSEGVAVATNPGVTIMVASGEYAGVTLALRTNLMLLGDAEKALVANGTVFSITGCRLLRFEGFTITGYFGSVAFSISGSTNILVTRNTIRNLSRDNTGYGGAFAGAGSSVQIIDNIINAVYGGQMGGGGYFSDCSLWVESNDFINCTAWNSAGGLRMTFSSANYTNRIRNNFFSGNLADYSGAIDVYGYAINSMLIDHNIIVGSGADYQWGGAVKINYAFASGTNTCRFLNNSVIDPYRWAFCPTMGLYVQAGRVYCANNIFTGPNWTPAYGVYNGGSAGDVVVEFNDSYQFPDGLYNVTATTNLFLDPLFINSTNGDFHLQTSSPCINAGNPDSYYNDANGSRNDMGVYGGAY